MNRKYRKTIIAANWKMNLLASGVKQYAAELALLVPDCGKWCEVVVCTPFTALHAAALAFGTGYVAVGAQNLSEHASGAYTGEISAEQLRDTGASYVIVGHSERRSLYGETDSIVRGKLLAALEHTLNPILCVGETLSQRENGVTKEVITIQLKTALYGIPEDLVRRIAIAYEPVWAIGTGRNASPEDAQDVCGYIRSVIRELYGAKRARELSILYGGSMNAKNASELLAQPDIDGGLIGGASLTPASFAEIINAAKQY